MSGVRREISKGQRAYQANRLRRVVGRNDHGFIYAPVALIVVRDLLSAGGARAPVKLGSQSRTPRGPRFRRRMKQGWRR